MRCARKNCRKDFYPKSINQKFCSKKCRELVGAKQQEKKRKERKVNGIPWYLSDNRWNVRPLYEEGTMTKDRNGMHVSLRSLN